MTLTLTSFRVIGLALSLSLAACASNTQSHISTAATTPFSDLNIIRADIPEVLEQALKQPYLTPTDQSCAAITLEVHKLDEALGADLDTPTSEITPSLIDQGAEAVGDSAMGALQSTAEGLIPFRSWVRKLSGADRYSKHVFAAVAAGSIRRAFLKGIGTSHGCPWGVSPRVVTSSTPH